MTARGYPRAVVTGVFLACLLAAFASAAYAGIPQIFTTVSAGGYYTCGLTPNGTVLCWGHDSYGAASPPAGQFTAVATSLSGAFSHTCGVKSDGTVECWGNDFKGKATPPAGLFVAVGVGTDHSCGLKPDGSVDCWGWNSYGQLSVPSASFAALSVGATHNCGLAVDGSVQCWGSDYAGQTTPPAQPLTAIGAGSGHSCGIRSDGSIACWGSNSNGQSSPPAGVFVQVDAGVGYTCGLEPDGTARCWGHDADGQASPPAGPFNLVTAGDSHSCGLRSDGSVECWGRNLYGESSPPVCGNGTVDPGETCDDANNDAGDYCSPDCQAATGFCGDATTQTVEECDDGASNSDTTPDACRTDCTLPFCGDAVHDGAAGEACDDGNNDNGDYCAGDCSAVTGSCGDGVIQAALEECDDGPANANTADACRLVCVLPFCGDGIVDSGAGGETCDGGGESATCDDDCTSALCGDGTVNSTAGEECEDGNTADGDTCSSACTIVRCQFDAPAKAQSMKVKLVRAYARCATPNATTAGGAASCSPAVTASPYRFGPTASCSVRLQHKLEPTCATFGLGTPCSLVRLKLTCRDVLDDTGAPISDQGWALLLGDTRVTMNHQYCSPETGVGDITFGDFPLEVYLPQARDGTLKANTIVSGGLNCFFDLFYPNPLWPCVSLEDLSPQLVDPNGNVFAVAGTVPASPPAGCTLGTPAKAKGMKTQLVRAYESCPGPTHPAPNNVLYADVAGCSLPVPTSQFAFGPDGACQLAVAPIGESSCTNGPPGEPCQNLLLKTTCSDVRDANDLPIQPLGGLGWTLRGSVRMTMTDPLAGDVTTQDLPFSIALPVAASGRLSVQAKLTHSCPGAGSPCPLLAPPCSSIELLEPRVVDPLGKAFASIGTSTR